MHLPLRRAALPAATLVLLAGLSGPAQAVETPQAIGGAALATPDIAVSPGTPPLPKDLTAAGWMVADLDTGDVLAAHAAHTRFAPASTLKTLTALTLIPRLPPKRLVSPTFQDIAVDGSKVGLVEGIRYPVSELFTSLMVVSGNDAANTLASAAGGTPTAVEAMNAEATRLQALDTHAVNPSGLDAPDQTSSPYDLGLIARAGMELPDFRAYAATKHATMTAPKGKRFEIGSHDKLLYNYPGAIGIKNGYTVKARASFVGAATRDGHTVLVTLMRADPRVWAEAAALLDWGFAATATGAAPVGQLVPPLPLAPAPVSVAASPAPAAPMAATTSTRPAGQRTWTLPRIAGLGFAALLAAGVAARLARGRRTRARHAAGRPRPSIQRSWNSGPDRT